MTPYLSCRSFSGSSTLPKVSFQPLDFSSVTKLLLSEWYKFVETLKLRIDYHIKIAAQLADHNLGALHVILL